MVDRCIFCYPDRDATSRIIWKNDDYYVLASKQPQTFGHVIVVPTKHNDNLAALSQKELSNFFTLTVNLANKIKYLVDANAYTLKINNKLYKLSDNSEQHVGHLHFHIIPYKGLHDLEKLPTSQSSSYFKKLLKLLKSAL